MTIPILSKPQAQAASILPATVTSAANNHQNSAAGAPITVTIDGASTAVNCECAGFNVTTGMRVYVQRVQNRLFVVGIAGSGGVNWNRPIAVPIADWNEAIYSGDYQSNPSSTSNAPDTTSYWIGHSYTLTGTDVIQDLICIYPDTTPCRRASRRGMFNGSTIVWDAWRISGILEYDYFEEWKFSAQSIASGVITKLTGLTNFSPNNNQNKLGGTPMNLSTGTWTCPLSGVYSIHMYCGTSAGSCRTEGIILNNTTGARLAAFDGTSQNMLSLGCERWVNLGDTINFEYYQASGAAGTVSTTGLGISCASIMLKTGRN
jgi:hypothetical protein